MDIVRRASAIFDTVIVALLDNPSKTPMFSAADRVALLKKSAAGLANVRVESFHGLLVDFAKSKQATVVIRGIRGAADLDYERQMADTNRHLYPEMDTILLTPSPAVAHISATLVRDIANLGGSVRGLVPDAVEAAIVTRPHAGRTQQV
jgi:pantetheine-phosphate adenylyltransferase